MLDIALIDSGNPWQNASADRFNGLFSGEGLSMDWFRFRVEGEVVINQLRRHYIGGRSRYNFNDMAPEVMVRWTGAA